MSKRVSFRSSVIVAALALLPSAASAQVKTRLSIATGAPGSGTENSNEG